MGGELKGMTQNLVQSRHEVIDRMVEEATAKGGDANGGDAFRHLRNEWDVDRDLCVWNGCEGA